MEKNNVSSLREMLEQMSIEQLDDLLNQELQSDTPDGNSVRLILSILREREKDYPIEITPEIQKAWKEYKQDVAHLDHENGRSGKAGSIILRIASVAAIVFILFSFVPKSVEAESFFDRLARWTGDILDFFTPSDDSAEFTDYQFVTDISGLQQIYDIVVEQGITDPVVPMWLPAGYELSEYSVKTTPSKKYLYSRFSDGASEVTYQINIYDTEVSHSFLKDDSQIKKQEINGMTYYIMRNINMWVVVWAKDNIECSISIDCQEDTLQKLLSSIYKMEGN